MFANNNTGKVEIHGRIYQTVAYRLAEFRKQYPIQEGWAIKTECTICDDNKVIFKAIIKNPEDKTIATGHAEERRNASYINKNSAFENAETSAIGRALAATGFVGNEFASADEALVAVEAQKAAVDVQNVSTKFVANAKVQAKRPSELLPSVNASTLKLDLPDTQKPGWEQSLVPKLLLPCNERGKPIKWIELILDTVKIQGRKKLFGGAQYLHIIESWNHPVVQRPEVLAVIKAALQLREKAKAAVAVS